MEYHLLILNKTNESLLCRNFLKIWASSAPVISLFSSKIPENLSDLHIDSGDTDIFKDSTPESTSFKYQQLYNELNKLYTLSQEDFSTIHTNLFKYLKRALFRPLLLLFKKNNNFVPSIVFNLKPILLYYYPSLNTPKSGHKEDKELLYWYTELNSNFNYVGTNNRLIELLDELEENIPTYNLNSQFTQLILSTLNMYFDGLVFRNIPLNKYTNILKYSKHHYSLLNTSPPFKFNTTTYSSCAATTAVNNVVHHSPDNAKETIDRNGSGKGVKMTSDAIGTNGHMTTTGAHSTATRHSTSRATTKHSPSSTTSGNEATSTHREPDSENRLEREDEVDKEEKLSLNDYRRLFLENNKPYHLASAIAYTNGYPHVGHAYEAVLCDVISRFYKVFGRKVIFSTGTDEHGIKVMTTAKQQNKTPIELCDYYSNHFKILYKKLLVEYDRFIRTTSETHIKAAKTIWKRVYNKGDIYLGKYNGYYSVREERFIPNTEAKLTDYKDPVSQKPYDLMSESSYFFQMDKYRNKLIKYINTNVDFIKPLKCKNEILARLKEPLDDLSISRTSFDWGIHVPKIDGNIENNEEKDYYNSDLNIGYNEDNKLFSENKFYNMVNRDNVSKRVNTTHTGHSDVGEHVKLGNDVDIGDVTSVCCSGTNMEEKEKLASSGTKSAKNQTEEKHVMYVWFDALSFYMTASGLGESFSEMTIWPTDLQIIGKDICWFQSVILATMCFSMELPLTKKIVAHGFIQGPDGRKMSKSLGNVLNLDELLAETGPEPFRYYLIKSTILGQDVNFDKVQLKELYNTDLADNVGNLVHRITNLINKYNQGIIPEYKVKMEYPFDYTEFVKLACNYTLKLDLYNLLILLNLKFKELNNYLTIKSPWAETSSEKRDSILRILLESVYFLGHLLYPVLPESSEELFRKIGTARKSNIWELSLNLENLDEGSKVMVGEVLYPKFNTESAKQ